MVILYLIYCEFIDDWTAEATENWAFKLWSIPWHWLNVSQNLNMHHKRPTAVRSVWTPHEPCGSYTIERLTLIKHLAWSQRAFTTTPSLPPISISLQIKSSHPLPFLATKSPFLLHNFKGGTLMLFPSYTLRIDR